MGKTVKLPKTECCVSAPRCNRCPVRMLADGTLPGGFGVRKRKLVRVAPNGKLGKKKVKKSDLKVALRSSA